MATFSPIGQLVVLHVKINHAKWRPVYNVDGLNGDMYNVALLGIVTRRDKSGGALRGYEYSIDWLNTDCKEYTRGCTHCDTMLSCFRIAWGRSDVIGMLRSAREYIKSYSGDADDTTSRK